MRRGVEPVRVGLEAERRDQLVGERLLPGAGVRGVAERRVRARLRPERDLPQRRAQDLEHRPHLVRLHPRLEVVEQRVVGVARRVEALGVGALELERALEQRPERREVVRLAGPSPRVDRA